MDLSVSEAVKNKELLKQLNRIVFHWTKQIKLTLADTKQTTSYNLLCHTDEHHFWINRC